MGQLQGQRFLIDVRAVEVLHGDVAEILEDRAHPATGLLNRRMIEGMLMRPLGTTSSLPDRAGLERARSIGTWVNAGARSA